MTHIDKHSAGSFCWIELATTDQNAAKDFYSSLFGWSPQDNPIGPSEFYTIFKLDGRDAAAGYTLREDQRVHGVPPNWMIYIAVDSADQAATKAKQLGGTVIAPPFDVMDLGRMAVIQDPTGAHFCVWQAAKNTGIGIGHVAGTLCWADLSTPDAKRASDFLKALAHESRLMILCILAEGEKSVSELEDILSLRQPTVSQQLARLRSPRAAAGSDGWKFRE